MESLDVVIVGAGTAGQTAAYDLSDAGLSVAVVDMSSRPGGVCALAGCQAKKWYYEATETVARAQHLMGKGIRRLPESDWQAVLSEKNKFTDGIPESTVNGFRGAEITYLHGRVDFIDPETLAVDGRPVQAETIVLATGARPMDLPFSGADQVIHSDTFLDLTELPNRVLFVGGGFISFEFSHFAARLGASPGDIHILELADRPLGGFDTEMVDLLVEASESAGIHTHTGIRIQRVESRGAGYRVVCEDGRQFDTDLVVHGAGRVPDIEGLGLGKAGITFNRQGILVNRHMQTSNPKVYAIGDCAATVQLARVADLEAHVAADAIVADREGGTSEAMDYRCTPFMLFTYPQYGMVGETEDALKQSGVRYWKSADRHLAWPTYRRIGMVNAAYKILSDDDGHILGAHIISDNASGLINTFRKAIMDRTDVDALHRENIMSPYPSRESDLIYMLAPLLE